MTLRRPLASFRVSTGLLSQSLGLLTGLLALTLAPIAQASDLLSVYAAAKANDPVLRQAVAVTDATKARVPQARASLLPQLSANANTSFTEQSFPQTFTDTDPTSPTFGQTGGIPDQAFNDNTWSATVSQPIINVPSWFTYTSSKANATAAEWNLASTEQTLIQRVVNAYMNVLRVEDQLEASKAEESAVGRQLEQVQQRFDVGLVAVTDVLESQAAFDDVVVRRVQAEGDQEIFFETLSTLTTVPFNELGKLEESLAIVDPNPVEEEDWVTTALATNLNIRSAEAQLSAARRTLRARRSERLPTVTASASYQDIKSGGPSIFGNGILIEREVYALDINLPIFLGGGIGARSKEAGALVEQARYILSEQQLTVARDTRNFYRAVATDVIRVGARKNAIKSAQSALEATETGYEVGTRNIVDVLLAQQRLYASQFDYADSRYNYVNNMIALKQAAGTLSEADLEALNESISDSDTVKRLSTIPAAN
ncbi:MAG: TolC family outer membrane protein [Pseudomonadota bacterium]